MKMKVKKNKINENLYKQKKKKENIFDAKRAKFFR